MQLLVNNDQYAFLRSTSEERVLVVLNRAEPDKSLQLEVEVDDIPLAEGLRFRSWREGQPDLVVSSGKLLLAEPKKINLYWTAEGPGR